MNVATHLTGRPSNASRASALPLHLFLGIDILNGTLSIWSGAPFTPVALAAKALLALYLCTAVDWTTRMLSDMCIVAACLASYALIGPHSAASALLLVKTAAVILLIEVLPPYLVRVPPAALAGFLRTAFCAIALSLLLGALGLGHERYNDGESVLRANGFFAAGNEVNVALVGLFWWLSSVRRWPRRNSGDTTLYWACLLLMLVSSSKTTILGAMVTLLLHARLRPASLLGVAVLMAAAAWLVVHSPIWDRWAFFFEIYADDGILSGLTNGRFSRPLDLFEDWREVPWTGLGILAAGWGYVESDPLDLLLNFGLAGALLFGVFAAGLARCKGRSMVPWLLVVAASVVAGHVVYSVFAMPVLVAAMAAADARRGPGRA